MFAKLAYLEDAHALNGDAVEVADISGQHRTTARVQVVLEEPAEEEGRERGVGWRRP